MDLFVMAMIFRAEFLFFSSEARFFPVGPVKAAPIRNPSNSPGPPKNDWFPAVCGCWFAFYSGNCSLIMMTKSSFNRGSFLAVRL
jgi:hypothetical protein